jgi:hypothetical protein
MQLSGIVLELNAKNMVLFIISDFGQTLSKNDKNINSGKLETNTNIPGTSFFQNLL